MVLRAENLVKKYKTRTVVNDVSVHVKQGEIVGLLGPNGAGKTTSFYMMVGLIKPNEGDIFLDDEEITAAAHVPARKKRDRLSGARGLGIPQTTVEENIMSVLEMREFTKKERKEKVDKLIEEFSLHKVRKNLGMSLSGGERRRTEIARALAVDPSFVLLDEPFAGVDPIAVEEIQSIVARLKNKNIGILITDHNVDETLSITDRAYLMVDGKLFKDGTAEELANDPQVRKVYLGQNFELRQI